jgi:hypothetical protein
VKANRFELRRVDYASDIVKTSRCNTITQDIQTIYDCIPNQSIGNETNAIVSKFTTGKIQYLQSPIRLQCRLNGANSFYPQNTTSAVQLIQLRHVFASNLKENLRARHLADC